MTNVCEMRVALGLNSDLITCSVEQGIIPCLDFISNSLPKYNALGISESASSSSASSNTRLTFPESHLVEVVDSYTRLVIHSLITKPASLSRFVNSLIHSGNSNLRMNILSSLLLIRGHSSSLGRYKHLTRSPQ